MKSEPTSSSSATGSEKAKAMPNEDDSSDSEVEQESAKPAESEESKENEIEYVPGDPTIRRLSFVKFGKLKFINTEEEGARGAFGWVRRFKDKYGRFVAVKKIVCNAENFSERQNDADRDVAILNHLSSSGRVNAYYFVFEDEKEIYIVTPWIEGQSLEKAFTECKTVEKFIRLLLKSARALQNLHKNNVIHGDLKADNVLVNPSEEMFYIDFSFGQFKGEPAHIFVDNCEHVAPECRAIFCEESGKDPVADVSQDIFSFEEMALSQIANKLQTKLDPAQQALLNQLKIDLQPTTTADPTKLGPIEGIIETLEKTLAKIIATNKTSTPYDTEKEEDPHSAGLSAQLQARQLPSKEIISLNLIEIASQQKKLINVLGLFWHASLLLKRSHEQGIVTTNHADFHKIIVNIDENSDVQQVLLQEHKKIETSEDANKLKEADALSFKQQLIKFFKNLQSQVKNASAIKCINALCDQLPATKTIDEIIQLFAQAFKAQTSNSLPQDEQSAKKTTTAPSGDESKKQNATTYKDSLGAALFNASTTTVENPNAVDKQSTDSVVKGVLV